MFFPYIPSCEAYEQFGAEPAQYGLEVNFRKENDLTRNRQNRYYSSYVLEETNAQDAGIWWLW